MFMAFINIKKANNLFNLYNLTYFSFSTLFVLLLPPFEYSYILPFSFIIFIYSFIGFKSFLPKTYKIILKITLTVGIIFIFINYFFINSSLIEGYEYRKFVKDLKKNYVISEQQKQGVFYLAEDAHDHFEEFYWQNKIKRPFCQIRVVSVSECKEVQEKSDDLFIYIIGKNLENLTTMYGHKIVNSEVIEANEDFNLNDNIKPFIVSLISEFNTNSVKNYKFEKIYKSKSFYYILLIDDKIPLKNFEIRLNG